MSYRESRVGDIVLQRTTIFLTYLFLIFSFFRQGCTIVSNNFPFYLKLEDTARYAGLLLAPAEGFGLRPRPIFGDFWCPVVTVVTFSSNLSNFERNKKKNEKVQKKSKKFQKISKNQKIKISKKKIQKIQ